MQKLRVGIRRHLTLLSLASAAHIAPAHAANGAISPFCTLSHIQTLVASVSPTIVVGEIANGAALPGGVLDIPPYQGEPEFCAVTGTVQTNPATGKTANFLLSMPINWNGKFLFGGCEGSCGTVGLPAPEALEHGYAVAATDDGHSGGGFDDTWAITAPGVANQDALKDFYDRAVHQVTLASKALTLAFYQQVAGAKQKLAHAYFQGCSEGGREAMVELSHYPNDFDGIIAGDPAFDTRGQNIGSLQLPLAQLRANDAAVPAALLSIIDAKVLARCDAADGVADGLIQNPGACDFRPKRDLPACPNNLAGPACFTTDQIQSVLAYFSAATNPAGVELHPGYPVSDLNDASGLNLAAYSVFPFPPASLTAAEPWGAGQGPSAWQAGDNAFKYFVYAGAESYGSTSTLGVKFAASTGHEGAKITDFHAIVPDATVAMVDSKTIQSDGDIPPAAQPFFSLGHKLIMYHGFSDGWITPFTTIQYYKALAALAGGYPKLQANARLFMVPGMYHCGGGPGPNFFDTLSALEGWVEQARPPDALLATKYSNDDPTQAVLRTMPLCKYPEQARYNGVGPVTQASAWTCPVRDQSLLHLSFDGHQAGEAAPLSYPAAP